MQEKSYIIQQSSLKVQQCSSDQSLLKCLMICYSILKAITYLCCPLSTLGFFNECKTSLRLQLYRTEPIQIRDTDMDMISHLQPLNTHTLTINLANNHITHMGVIPFCLVKWEVLTSLNLQGNKIGNRGCQYLSRCTLPKLQQLNLNQCNVQDAGILHLAKTFLPSLEEFRIQRNQIIGERISWLSKAPWPKLRIIYLWTNLAKPWLLLRLSVYLVCPGNTDLYLDYWRVDQWRDNRILREIYNQRALRAIHV